MNTEKLDEVFKEATKEASKLAYASEGSVTPTFTKVLKADATKQELEDTTITWYSSLKDGNYFYRRSPSIEETMGRVRRYSKARTEHMFDYVLKKYGRDVAVELYTTEPYHTRFLNTGFKVDVDLIPYCQDGQCDFRCKYYEKGCGCTSPKALDTSVTA